MAVTQTLIKSRATNDFSPASILSHVNDEVSYDNKTCMFVTVLLGILNIKTGELVYANAGHNPPYLLHDDASIKRLDQRHGVVIGAMSDLAYEETHEQLSSGDMLLVYTDGVTEAMNEKSELYTEKALAKLLSSRSFESSEDAVHTIIRSIRQFEGSAQQADDITVLGLRFLGLAEGKTIDRFKAVLKNHKPEIERVTDDFSKFSEKHGFPESILREVSIVFDELLHNIMSYAYKDDREHEIAVLVELSGDRLKIEVTDDGIPFNPFALDDPDTTLSIEEREIGGLGIHLVRNIMDNISYHRKVHKNVVTLVKHIKSENNR